LNTELFIANRLAVDSSGQNTIARPILKISVYGIALSLAVMIISICTVTGFKSEIRRKLIGFGSHIQILNFDSNSSYETNPISKHQSFTAFIDSIPGIKHVQVYATKPGIMKSKDEIQGAIVKGIGSDFDWSFFRENLVEGESFTVDDSVTTDKVVISSYMSKLLGLKPGDRFAMYFIDDRPRGRVFSVSGVYQTSLVEFDKQFILADIKNVQSLNGWEEDQITGFEILINNYDDLDRMKEAVFSISGQNILPDGSKLKVVSIRDIYPQIFDWLGLIDKNVWILLGLMLLVSVFNMVSCLLIMILDRTSMIGILKSLGSGDHFIRNVFLYQAGHLMIKGLFWGNLLGIGLCLLQDHFKFITLNPESYFLAYVPVHFNIWYILVLNAGVLFITLVMLILPSRVISRIDPARTLVFK
jgi:lipoprotein-releasing system permease protein